MPLLRNNFQPYFPDPNAPNNYQCGSEKYCHPINQGDTIYTQFTQTPCNNNEVTDPEFDDFVMGSELLTNPSFSGNANGWFTGSGTPITAITGLWNWDAGNRIAHEISYTSSAYQSGIGLTTGSLYVIEIDITRTAGSVYVQLGDGANANNSDLLETTGSFTFQLFHTDTDDKFQIIPSTDFDGYINSVSIKEKTFTYWNPNGQWNLENGMACWVGDSALDLIETASNYIMAGTYYKFQLTVENLQSQITVNFADLVYVIQANGNYTYYGTPTLDGVIKINAPFDVDDTVCVSGFAVYELRNDYSADLFDYSGNSWDLSNYYEYYEDYVTLSFNFEDLVGDEQIMPDGCYYIEVIDSCLVTSDNLVSNGDFALGFTDWTKNNGASQYDDSGNQMTFIFDPFTGQTDYVTNGDFSSGTGWTTGGNWTILGGKANHSPGSTATLSQTLTLPAIVPPATSRLYYIGFTVSGRTTGTITCKIGTTGSSFTWGANDTFIQYYQCFESGSVDITFTPSSTFDGSIDDVIVVQATQVSNPILINIVNPNFVNGNYQVTYDITASSDTNIKSQVYIQNQPSIAPYFSTIGTHSYSVSNYVPGAQRALIMATFSKVVSGTTTLIVGSITVDNIDIVRVSPFQATYTSECLSYSNSGHERTKMLVGYCDQPSFGFEFENTGFRLQQRAVIRSINPVYKKDKNLQFSGTGDARVTYSEVSKYWEVHTDFASETFHDAMAVIIDCDHFLIGDAEDNGKEYIADPEDYTPNWQGDGTYTLATAVMNVRIKEDGQKFNRHI